MNPIERAVRGVDAWQQRHRATAFGFAVVKKFGDDQAGYLVALLTYFAFLAIFPLLLALSEVLNLVLRGHPALQQRLETSALSDFPIIGEQLRSQLGASSHHNPGPALAIGLAGAVIGGRGLANAVQHTLNSVWSVPKVNRPGFPWNLLRTLGLLGLLGVGTVLTAGAASVAGAGQVLWLHGLPFKALALGLSTMIDIGLFLAAFRLATAKSVRTRELLFGAALSGVAWQVLLSFAGVIINHNLRHAQALAGLFGVVLGLLAWFGLQATVTVYALEADVVRARRLWPRSITQPPLTSADKRFLTQTANAEVRRPEQEVTVEFSPQADHDPLREPPANRPG